MQVFPYFLSICCTQQFYCTDFDGSFPSFISNQIIPFGILPSGKEFCNLSLHTSFRTFSSNILPGSFLLVKFLQLSTPLLVICLCRPSFGLQACFFLFLILPTTSKVVYGSDSQSFSLVLCRTGYEHKKSSYFIRKCVYFSFILFFLIESKKSSAILEVWIK